MISKVSFRSVRNIALYVALLFVTIAWATTTEGSYSAFIAVRTYFLAPLLILLSAILLLNRHPGEFFISCLVGAVLVCVSLLSSYYSESQYDLASYIHEAMIFMMVNVAFLGVYSVGKHEVIERSSLIYLLVGSLCVLSYTVYAGGLVFSYPPYFVFSHLESAAGVSASYSQGVSKFYGMAAIASFLIYEYSAKRNFWYALLTIGFLVLSFLGGGRGDFISVIFVIAAFSRLRLAYVLFLGVLLVGALFVDWGGLGAEIPVIGRYAALQGNYGYRDVLVGQAFELLANEPRCLLIGCGIGYFQDYWNYPSSMYPHNLFLESIISFGAVLTIGALFFAFLGFKDIYKREGRGSFFIAVSSYFLLIGLKSGGLFSSWVATSSVLYAIALGLKRIIASHGAKRRAS